MTIYADPERVFEKVNLRRDRKGRGVGQPISVIIPTYNRAKSIKKSVESVLRQDYEELEVIVVDDGSSDGTERLLGKISDKRLRYHRQTTNGGAARARNTGIELAQYNLIAFQDSDDIWRPNKLSAYMKYWEEHSDIVLLYSPFLLKYPDGSVQRTPSDEPEEELSGDIYPYLLRKNTIGAPTVMATKEVLQRVGGFRPEYPALEDWELALRIAKEGKIGYIDEVYVDVAATDGGLSSSATKYFDARCRMLAEYYDDMVKYGVFDQAATGMLKWAEQIGCLDAAKKLLMLYLSTRGEK